MRETWTYRGVLIHRDHSRNSMGLRYWAFGEHVPVLRGATLADVRELIRRDLGVE